MKIGRSGVFFLSPHEIPKNLTLWALIWLSRCIIRPLPMLLPCCCLLWCSLSQFSPHCLTDAISDIRSCMPKFWFSIKAYAAWQLILNLKIEIPPNFPQADVNSGRPVWKPTCWSILPIFAGSRGSFLLQIFTLHSDFLKYNLSLWICWLCVYLYCFD